MSNKITSHKYRFITTDMTEQWIIVISYVANAYLRTIDQTKTAMKTIDYRTCTHVFYISIYNFSNATLCKLEILNSTQKSSDLP
jgi:hypothetical protein